MNGIKCMEFNILLTTYIILFRFVVYEGICIITQLRKTGTKVFYMNVSQSFDKFRCDPL